MAVTGSGFSIVEYYGDNDGYRCGYCKSPSSNFSHGMWAHSMTVQDYQDLIDRGWRRSGQYIYKPTMHVICCPMYTIRCAALSFKPTKSQKKIIKRVHRFLAYGRKSDKSDNISQSSDVESEHGFENISDIPCDLKEKAEKAAVVASNSEVLSVDPSLEISRRQETSVKAEGVAKRSDCKDDTRLVAATELVDTSFQPSKSSDTSHSSVNDLNLTKSSKPGLGADSNRPACKKAKILRLERKKLKLQSKGMTEEEVARKLSEKSGQTEKTLEDFFNEQVDLLAISAHRLEIRLVNSNLTNREFQETFDAAYEVYQKYQVAIHGDPPSKCSKRQFTRFLVNSPLKLERNGPPTGYGSFHQQYWLDDKLIAVGVIDILPSCVSSVYFYYDPDYGDLSLGTYAALRETSFTRSLHYHAPSLKFYYMGFYIDSCPKMRYKARLKPSFLLCPEVYSWHPFEEAHLKLQKSKYSRFNDDKNARDPDGDINIDMVLVLFNNTGMEYRTYKNKKSPYSSDDTDQVKEYASLVGMKCARRLLLYRSQS